MNQVELFRKLAGIFLPYAMERLEDGKRRNIQFAHYTSAAVGLEILRKKKVWMRNAVVMNDFSEVQHGQDCVIRAWNDEALGPRISAALEAVNPNLKKSVEEAFDGQIHARQTQSYILSISEHGSGALDEDKYGRLSMWRAYGGDTNVAFIMKNTPFFSESTALNAFTSPVLYCDPEDFKKQFQRVVENIESEVNFLKSIPSEYVTHMMINALNFAVLSTKHPGFAEEKEWRVIYSPSLWPSDKIGFDIEVVAGVPQKVYKVELKNYPEEGFVGATVPELLEEIIIGPTQYPWPIYDAYCNVLEAEGVPNPLDRVRVSGIPLRR